MDVGSGRVVHRSGKDGLAVGTRPPLVAAGARIPSFSAVALVGDSAVSRFSLFVLAAFPPALGMSRWRPPNIGVRNER